MTIDTTLGVAAVGESEQPDLNIVDGNIIVEKGIESVRQRVLQRLSFLFGEWFMNRRIGVPYIAEVFASGGGGVAASILASHVAEVQGVDGVTILDFNINAQRIFELRLSVSTEDGDFEVSTTRSI